MLGSIDTAQVQAGDPAAYSYDRDGACGSLAIHVDDTLTAGNAQFYYQVIVLLLSQFSISKIEKKHFKFLDMRLTQTDNFCVRMSQDAQSIKELLQGVDSFSEREKTESLEVTIRPVTLLRLDTI